jgi:cytochrome d ubiquinol oxidase subunit I
VDAALAIHRLHFAFTVTYHYLFPQLTMGLAALLVIFKTLALRSDDEVYGRCARFWARLFGINFAVGVVDVGQCRVRPLSLRSPRHHR